MQGVSQQVYRAGGAAAKKEEIKVGFRFISENNAFKITKPNSKRSNLPTQKWLCNFHFNVIEIYRHISNKSILYLLLSEKGNYKRFTTLLPEREREGESREGAGKA